MSALLHLHGGQVQPSHAEQVVVLHELQQVGDVGLVGLHRSTQYVGLRTNIIEINKMRKQSPMLITSDN